MARMIDLLAGVLTGANYGGEVKSLYFDHSEPQNAGHIFIAIRSNLFRPDEEFISRMDTVVKRAKSCSLVEGFDEILIPGEPEERVATKRRESGVPVSEKVYESLLEEAKRYKVELKVQA